MQTSTGIPKGKDAATDQPFEPSAATASSLLIAQGSTVLCLHHDSLAIDRRFQKHNDNILIIAVDNVSERGPGRLVVTYDAKQTAIVWDLYTGEQISRFASYVPLTVAAWMRNGNIAFGKLSFRLFQLTQCTDGFRQWQRRSHSLRTINERAHICTNHI